MNLIKKALSQIQPALQNSHMIGEVLSAALKAADPYQAVRANLDYRDGVISVSGFEHTILPGTSIYLIALGKAAPAMTDAAMGILGDCVTSGVCVYKHDPTGICQWSKIKSIAGNHPVPGRGSLLAGQAIRDCASKARENDLVLLLISGGGSSLATLPVEGIKLSQIQDLTSVLLRSGASIHQINAVRKHIDRIKGGGVLKMAAPAKIEALVLSDVVGDALDVIASGPAYPDLSTFCDALTVVESARETGKIPAGILAYLEKGRGGELPETLKPDDRLSSDARHTVIGSIRISCLKALETARSIGIDAEILTTSLTGEAREQGALLARVAVENQGRKRPFMLICGGETTVHVRGTGKGGRNLEVALGAVRGMAETHDTSLVTFATDGEDGPTDAAGALVTQETLANGLATGQDPLLYLDNNDAYTYFERIDRLLKTGPTGTNVNDLSLIFGF